MQRFVDEVLVTVATLAPFLLLGFLIAGLLHAFVPRSLLVRAMGGSGIGSIGRATLVGIPLPLCSCAVIPVATELRKQGAGRGATAAFMVSTPETGVDSIFTSFAVLHPILVIARPVAAMLTSLLTGIAVERLVQPPAETTEDAGGCCSHDPAEAVRGASRGLFGGVKYAFVDLLGEITPYLIPAILLTALMGIWLGPESIDNWNLDPWLQRLILLGAGVPIYVCATSATPVAAALMIAGVSPGAALVFLLAGPATNIVTIAAIRNTLGKGSAIVYVLVVASASYLFGTLTDLCWSDLAGPAAPAHMQHEHLTTLHWVSAGILGVFLIGHAGRKIYKRFL